MRIWLYIALVTALLGVAGCSTNPVTGKDELAFISQSQELEIGKKQYAPSRQMQGGDYVLDPQLNKYVSRVGQRLAAVSDRKLPYEFSVINDATPNAWALPGGKIAVNRGLLLELESEAELAAVLSHEIVHAAARHGAQGMQRGMLLQGVVLAAGVASSSSDYSRAVVGAASVGANLINQRYSRDAESESDYYGMLYMVRAGYDPAAAVKLQETFVRLSKSRKKNEQWYSGLFASHPPSEARVRENRETLRKLGAKGGDWGRDRYQHMIAGLKKSKPAYDALEKGLKALKDDDEKQALKLANKAIAIEPKEALFYSLLGDVRYKQKRYNKALKHYNQALDRNSGFFRYYLERGVTWEKLENNQKAQLDLEKSVELLPTAIAYNALGRMELQSGSRDQAKQYFGQAAGSRSPAGVAAAAELMRLDLPDNPGRYLQTRLQRLKDGEMIAVVQNQTKMMVRNVGVGVGLRAPGGRLSNMTRHSVWGVIRPGEVARIRLGIRLDSSKQLRKYGVVVLGADIADKR